MSESQDHFEQVEKEIQKAERVEDQNEHVSEPDRVQIMSINEPVPEHVSEPEVVAEDIVEPDEEEEEPDDALANAFLEGIYTVAPTLLEEMISNILFHNAKNPNRMLHNRIKRLEAKDQGFQKVYEFAIANIVEDFRTYEGELKSDIQDTIEEVLKLFTE